MAEPGDSAPRRILIVEDDARLASLLSRFLSEHGFDADIVGNGLLVEPEVRRAEPALVLLDLLLPGLDGIEVCQQLRRFSAVPIIVLSARTEEIDRLLALEMGADDFIAKPYSPREMLARIKALLRRVEGRLGGPVNTHGFRIDEGSQRIAWEESWLPLTPAEYRLLRKLLSRPGQVFRRTDLNEGDEGQTTERVVDSHIKNLRRKISQVRPQGSAIVSVYGLGYRFDPQAAQDAG